MSSFSRPDIARWRMHNQHLAGVPVRDAVAVVRDLLAIQAENHSQATWAIATRCATVSESTISRLYDDGALLRTHVLRTTWHFVLPDDIGWLLDLSRPRVLRSWERQLEQQGISRRTWERSVAAIVDAVGVAQLTRLELGDRLAGEGLLFNGQTLMLIAGLAEVHGLICSGARRGGEHTYDLFTNRVPHARRLEPNEALAELVRRYFTSHGPATDRDLAYWATLPLRDVRAGLADVSHQLGSFELDGSTFWYGRDVPAGRGNEPRAHLLQILDEYYRGYQDTRLMLDLAGLTTPGREPSTGMTIIDSQLAGTMKRTVTADTVAFEIRALRPLNDLDIAAIHEAGHRYGQFLDRTPNVVIK